MPDSFNHTALYGISLITLDFPTKYVHVLDRNYFLLNLLIKYKLQIIKMYDCRINEGIHFSL